MRSKSSISSRTRTSSPVSSRISRPTASSIVSPISMVPPGMDHWPSSGSVPRRIRTVRPRSTITPPMPTTGRSGYSLEEAISASSPLLAGVIYDGNTPRRLNFHASVYNTLQGGGDGPRTATWQKKLTEAGPVIRCPECSAEIDVDEDEVEEGEILSCPECESELEVSQTHPVHLNVISDDLDEEDEEEEETEVGEDGDYSDEEEEESEEEDEE